MNKIGEFGLPSFQTYSKDTVMKPGDLGGGIHRYSKQEKKKRDKRKPTDTGSLRLTKAQ